MNILVQESQKLKSWEMWGRRYESTEMPQISYGYILKQMKSLVISKLQIKIPLSFNKGLRRKNMNTKFKRFLSKFSHLLINIPLLKDL